MNFLYIFQFFFFALKTETISFVDQKKIFLVNLYWVIKNTIILFDHFLIHFYLRFKIRKNNTIDEKEKFFFTEFIKINKDELFENLKSMLVEYLLFVVVGSMYYRVYFINTIKSFSAFFDNSLKKLILNQ